ncbi:MAG: hypothetical protein NTW03_11825, partial [Verrucomicrobia bacterium]|nr:hypothetical protein [Verrucomicrobiota bacterium]
RRRRYVGHKDLASSDQQGSAIRADSAEQPFADKTVKSLTFQHRVQAVVIFCQAVLMEVGWPSFSKMGGCSNSNIASSISQCLSLTLSLS